MTNNYVFITVEAGSAVECQVFTTEEQAYAAAYKEIFPNGKAKTNAGKKRAVMAHSDVDFDEEILYFVLRASN